MKTAEFTHHRFMATLDRRTCARCGERDGEVYKLSEMNQGENAPPMHARCRCTIVAYLDGVGKGERVAGRERLPEDVTYKQWRARYVDGENWHGARLIKACLLIWKCPCKNVPWSKFADDTALTLLVLGLKLNATKKN